MIRLINTEDLSIHTFEGKLVPKYGILSHRWEQGEISLQELQSNLNPQKAGWLKLRKFCQYARQRNHGFVWIDTCCIDKTSSAELSESINSMFRWYRRAEVCYAYLHTVPAKGDLDDNEWMALFRDSEWFTRGWTLQELLAPRDLIFVCFNWEQDIGSRASLSKEVQTATKIPEKPLIHGWNLKDGFGGPHFTVAQIMSWASHRQTTRVEDMAYSLMGLFSINMSLLYGEGLNAFVRLQLEIMGKYDDNSLFAWEIPTASQHLTTTRALNQSLDLPESYTWGGLVAPTIRCFESCTNHSLQLESYENGRLFSMTNRGIQVEGLLRRYAKNRQGGGHWLLPLNCGRDALWTHQLGVVLNRSGQFALRAVNSQVFDSDIVDCDRDGERKSRADYERLRIFIPQAWPGDYD